METNNKRNAVFLDRDDTIIVDAHYANCAESVELLPNVIEGLKQLMNEGYLLIVITNQSGIARGIITQEEHTAVKNRFLEILKNEGVEITDYFYCPHYPTGEVKEYTKVCDCRKGMPGMLLEAARRYDISMADSWMIGDRSSDVEAGIKSGVRTIRIGDENAFSDEKIQPNFYAENLNVAAGIITKNVL